MIRNSLTLYTWADVYDFLRDKLPDCIVWFRAYTDGVQLGVKEPKDKDEVVRWLQDQLKDRYQDDKIILDFPSKETGYLLVSIEELDDFDEEDYKSQPYAPTFERPDYILNSEIIPYKPLKDDIIQPSVIAFHSFKGGVGRTLHTLLFALSYNKLHKKSKILLVDADFEAPGISYWYEDSKPPSIPTAISYADILTIAHSDSSDDYQDTIDFACSKLEDQLLDLEKYIYVLPAFRNQFQLESIPIKPEQLYQDRLSPLYPQELLKRIGAKLGVDVVIVDLRAGMSDLSSGILFDPRVCRVFVTTFSGQSRRGSLDALETLQRYMPKLEAMSEGQGGYTPIAIINQIRDRDLEQDSFVKDLIEFENELKVALKSINVQDQDEDTAIADSFCIRTPFREELLNLPSRWKELLRLVSDELTSAINELGRIVYTLPIPQSSTPSEKSESSKNRGHNTRLEKISKLKKSARTFFAESVTEEQRFFITDSLKALATDFRQALPNEVIAGVKGTGKTYTAQQILIRKTWREFVKECLGSSHSSRTDEILVFPALQSRNQDPFVADVGWGEADNSKLISSWLAPKDGNYNLNWWIEHWKDILAWQAGYSVGIDGVGDSFLRQLSQDNKKLLAVVDGIEDYFQNIEKDEVQQVALRVLLQEIPQQLIDTNMGILIFVREDMISHAIKYNAQQFMNRYRYKKYKLNWSRDEALKLAVWLAREALDIKTDVETLSKDELEEYTIQIWGRKLGKDNSRQSYSSAWILDVLSNFNNALHARDIVRFVHFAAEDAESRLRKETSYSDRLLDPESIRNAVGKASKEKIKELEQEISGLQRIFKTLRELPKESKRSPIEEGELTLQPKDIEFLVENGVIQREKNNLIFFAEIFRQGLGFERARRGQSRVRR